MQSSRNPKPNGHLARSGILRRPGASIILLLILIPVGPTTFSPYDSSAAKFSARAGRAWEDYSFSWPPRFVVLYNLGFLSIVTFPLGAKLLAARSAS